MGQESKMHGGLTSFVVPRVELLYPQLAEGLGKFQLLPGNVVPEKNHVFWADFTLRTDDGQNVLERHFGAHTHNSLLGSQVIHYQAHRFLEGHPGQKNAVSVCSHTASPSARGLEMTTAKFCAARAPLCKTQWVVGELPY